jgi:NitT/TauT family transport system ATP-binding protein
MLDVPFGRPRNVMELQREAQFGNLVHDIWMQLREEVDRARSQNEMNG